jgi:SPX domain protein involved in polyphosphate accumulation
VEDPVLEKKIKINLLGNKEYQSMESFSLGHTWPDVNSKLSTNYLYPLVIVQYDRTYLESADHSIRATIDRDLHYYRITNNEIAFPSHRDNGLIIEIKYDQQSEDYAAHCMQYIPYRMTKNSKYVSAMQYYLL